MRNVHGASVNLARATFVEELAIRFGITKKLAGEIFDYTFEAIGEHVRNGLRVSVPGFGVFAWRSRKARNVRNQHTAEIIRLPRRWAVTFRASKHQKRFDRK